MPHDPEYMQTQLLMNNAESFDELLAFHRLWLNDEITGFSYERFCTASEIEGDEQFIDLLKYVTDKLCMVVTESHPGQHYFKESRRPIKKSRPYISGYMEMDTFWKIFKYNQSELSIIGALPLIVDEVIPFVYDTVPIPDNLEDYRVYRISDECNLYGKNVIFDEEEKGAFVLHKYKIGGALHEGYGKAIWIHNYHPQALAYCQARQRDSASSYRWQDHKLCHVCLTHSEYGVYPGVYEKLVRDLCNFF